MALGHETLNDGSADANWLPPSDAALKVHNSVQDVDDLCRTRSTSSTSAGSSRAEDSDDEVEAEPELLAAVERHLDEMNRASEEVNELQGELNDCLRRRRAAESKWAQDCVHLAKAIGMDLVAQAMPYIQQQQRCSALHEAVERNCREFHDALAAAQHKGRRRVNKTRNSSVAAYTTDLSRSEAMIAASLDDYRAAEELLQEEEVRCGISQELLRSVLPFFEAEADFKKQVEEAKGRTKELSQKLEVAKKRYRSALQSLEALSEEEHRQRGNAGDALSV